MPTQTAQPARMSTSGISRLSWSEQIAWARTESLENRRCARRVRYEARDALGVIGFSAAASTLVSIAVTVALSWLG